MFNVEATVLNSLGTVQDQTYENIEILCVDDGSTDRTVEMVEGFSNDPRIRIVRQENRGLGGARNTGIREAKGGWLTFVDSDDWIHPRMVETLVAKAVSDPELDIIECLHSVVDESGAVTASRARVIPADDSAYFASVMSGRDPVMACAKIYRASIFEDEDSLFPEATLHEDVYVTYRHFWFARRAATVPEVLYVWKHRVGSLSRSATRKHVDDTLGAFVTCWEFLVRRGLADRYVDDFYVRCAHFSANLFDKIGKYAAGTASRETFNYLRRQLTASPYFSNKMAAVLRDRNPKLLATLSSYGDFWGRPAEPQVAPPKAKRRRVKPRPDYSRATLAGLLWMAYRKITKRKKVVT